MPKPLIIYLAAINLIALLAFGWDKILSKRKAKNPSVRRIPEKTLFGLAIAGGSVGAIVGMFLFRHKTQHASFRIGLPLILLAHIALAFFLLRKGF